MALSKQIIPISFGQGIDTKQDSKQLVPGKLLVADNVVFDTLNMFSKRNGYDLLAIKDAAQNAVSGIKNVLRFKDELCLLTDSALWSYSNSTQNIYNKGALYTAEPTVLPVLHNNYNHDSVDSVVIENLQISVFHNTILNDVRYSVQDLSSGSFIVNNDVVDTSSSRIKVASIGSKAYLVYLKGSEIRFKTINAFNPILSSSVLVASNVDTTAPTLDAENDSSSILVAYNSNTAGAKVAVFKIFTDNSLSSIIQISSSDGSTHVGCKYDQNMRIVVTYSNASMAAYSILAYTMAGTLLTHTIIETVSGPGQISFYEPSAGQYKFIYEIKSVNSRDYYLKQVLADTAGLLGSATVLKRSVGLAAKCFKVNGSNFIVARHSSTLQNTIFVLDESSNVATKLLGDVSGPHVSDGSLTKTSVDGVTARFTAQIKGQNISENGKFYSLLGVASCAINFDTENAHQSAEMGENLHVSGGLLSVYDGDTLTEHGFNIYPEDIHVAASSAVGSIAAGNYGYSAVYSWTDNRGLQHRSAPSPAVSYDFITSAFPTAKLAVESEITLTNAIKGTYNNGNTFQLVVAAAAPNTGAEVLASISGTYAATVLTITPNDGTNNANGKVFLTSAEIVELINTGAVAGKTVVLTDKPGFRLQHTASGGSTKIVTASTTLATYAGGAGTAASGTINTTTPITVYSRSTGTTNGGLVLTLKVLPANNNPTNTIKITVLGSSSNIVLNIEPNNGANNGGTPVNLTTAELAEFLKTGGYSDTKTFTVAGTPSLLANIWASGGGVQDLVDGGEGDNLEATLSGGTEASSMQVVVPTLRLTSKTDVVVELYRTEASGTIFYKVSSINSPTFNDPTVDSVTIVDTLKDADLISRETLYTTGGVLENVAPPASRIVAAHTASDRIFVVGDRPNVVQYSKISGPGYPVEFNDTLERQVDPIGGRITALSSMDEKIIIFKEDAIMYMSGSGPNNLGQQDSFTEPERISVDVGCIEPKSVILVPDGLMFKSRKGIYLLSRSMQVQYVGAPVQAYNALKITSAKIIGELNQVRFTTADGPCLVYNYFVQQWGTYQNHSALSAEVIGSDYYYLRSSSELLKENRQSFSDAGSPIRLKVQTGWISFAQLQGFMRVYKMLILGQFKSAHKLRIRVAYDFNEAWVQEQTINTADFIDASPYGTGTYGSEALYGGDGNVYQIRVDFARQKCQSIKIMIEDVQEAPGEGLSLSAITLQIGGKQGTNKMASSKTYGTT